MALFADHSVWTPQVDTETERIEREDSTYKGATKVGPVLATGRGVAVSRPVGSDTFRYELVDSWPDLPRGWEFKDAAGAGVNSRGEVHVFSRGDHPVTVWDSDGGFITSWGYGHFTFPHGIHIAPNDDVWLVDNIIHHRQPVHV